MDGITATITFNCGMKVTNVGNIDMALSAHAKTCNCEVNND